MDNSEKSDNKIINVRPLCIITVSFLCGIYCAYSGICDNILLAFLIPIAFCAIVAVICFIRRKQESRLLIFFLTCVLFFTFGALDMNLRALAAKNSSEQRVKCEFVGRVDEIVEYEVGKYRIIFDKCQNDGNTLSGKAVCYTYASVFRNREIRIGDIYSFRCTLKNNYLSGDIDSNVLSGIYYNVSISGKITYVNNSPALFKRVYLYVKNVLKNGMQPESYGIGLALITGDTSEISSSTLNNYRMAGIAHVFAVSGLHVGTLASAIALILKRLKLKRRHVFVVTVIIAGIYCAVCGFSNSSVRALIMSALLLLADCIGFKRDSLSAVAVAALSITALRPTALFDVGFQLSFAAVVFIIILSPTFLRGANNGKILGESLSVSLSAQLGTMPILADMSGYISVISLFVNIIFVPIVVIAFQLLLICLLIGIIEFLICGSAYVCLFLPDRLIYAIDFLINLFNFENTVFTATFGNSAIVYYTGLVCVSDVVNIDAKHKIALAVVSAALTVLSVCLS